MILSFHPIIEGDKNILCAGRLPNHDDIAAISKADAVILPQGCAESLYYAARDNCELVFPNFDSCFQYPGKIGQTKLFQETAAPHPKTFTFPSLDAFYSSGHPVNTILEKRPVVAKFDTGDEGYSVYFLSSGDDVNNFLATAAAYEKTGQFGFLLQEYIPCGNRSLRVVIMYKRIISYWRVQRDTSIFGTSLKNGAMIDHDLDPHIQERGRETAEAFCADSGINLAGLDYIFSEDELRSGIVEPLLLEVNYYFGRKGLGGSENYYIMLEKEIRRWLTDAINPGEKP